MRRQVPLLLASFIGFLMLADSFIKMPVINQTAILIRNWVVIISIMSLVVGALSLLRVHATRIAGQKPGWVNSCVLVTTMTLTVVIGLGLGKNSSAYSILYDGIMQPGSSTVYGLLAFYIASAAIRSFRARSIESTLLLVTAVIVMLGNAPIGATISSRIPLLGAWIMKIPSNAAQRGLIITSSLAFIAINLRNIVGLSSEWLGGSKD